MPDSLRLWHTNCTLSGHVQDIAWKPEGSRAASIHGHILELLAQRGSLGNTRTPLPVPRQPHQDTHTHLAVEADLPNAHTPPYFMQSNNTHTLPPSLLSETVPSIARTHLHFQGSLPSCTHLATQAIHPKAYTHTPAHLSQSHEYAHTCLLETFSTRHTHTHLPLPVEGCLRSSTSAGSRAAAACIPPPPTAACTARQQSRTMTL